MPDFYDKLGELLKESLKSGNFFKENENIQDTNTLNTYPKDKINQNIKINTYKSYDQQTNQQKTVNREKVIKNKEQSRGQVIKMYKYTKNMHIPKEIQDAFSVFNLDFTTDKIIIRKRYHQLLKQCHPDTKNTIQDSNNVYNNRQLTPQDITFYYNLILKYLNS